MEYLGLERHMWNRVRINKKNKTKDEPYKEVIELAEFGDVEAAYNKLVNISYDMNDFWQYTIQKVYDEISPEKFYIFLMYLYIKTGNEDCNLYMAGQMVYNRPFTDDPYQFAFYHINKAINNRPDEIKYKEFLIDYIYDYPVKFMSHEEYVEIARQILEKNPNHQKSLKILNERKQE